MTLFYSHVQPYLGVRLYSNLIRKTPQFHHWFMSLKAGKKITAVICIWLTNKLNHILLKLSKPHNTHCTSFLAMCLRVYKLPSKTIFVSRLQAKDTHKRVNSIHSPRTHNNISPHILHTHTHANWSAIAPKKVMWIPPFGPYIFFRSACWSDPWGVFVCCFSTLPQLRSCFDGKCINQ